jgi:histone H2A
MIASTVPVLRKDPVSHSQKSGIVFPVGRIHRYLKKKHDGPVSKTAAVYMAGVLEYLTSDVLELAVQEAKALKKKRITERSISLTFEKDKDLKQLIGKNTIIAGGGVLPDVRLTRKRKIKVLLTEKS